MKFVHLADSHLDGYRDPRLAKCGYDNFIYVINFAIEKKVDFVLIAGDLFNTALPRVDALKLTTEQLKRLQDEDIPVYIIPGSHDYSPHGRTMLDVLELAGLVKNVAKNETTKEGKLRLHIIQDKKTQAYITGIMGRAGMLDQDMYKNVENKAPDIPGFKIFMFHTAIEELKNQKLAQMDASPLHLLPSGFDYYAGGHVHIVNKFSSEAYKNVVYPGPTFPNSFSELEDLRSGTFVYFDSQKNLGTDKKPLYYKHLTIPNKKVSSVTIDANNKTPESIMQEAHEKLTTDIVLNSIVLLRFSGTIEGKASDIDFKELLKLCYDNGAYVVLKNTNKLQSKIFEEIVTPGESAQKVEEDTIAEHLNQFPINQDELQLISTLLTKLNIEQHDGEKKTVFTERVVDTAKTVCEIPNP